MRDLFEVLLRLFFGGFFDNELVWRQGEMTASIAKIIGVLAAPGLLCFWLMPKYSYYAFQPPAIAEGASLPDKLFFITFSMAVIGFVPWRQWDALFADRLNFPTLIRPPIRLQTISPAPLA